MIYPQLDIRVSLGLSQDLKKRFSGFKCQKMWSPMYYLAMSASRTKKEQGLWKGPINRISRWGTNEADTNRLIGPLPEVSLLDNVHCLMMVDQFSK